MDPEDHGYTLAEAVTHVREPLLNESIPTLELLEAFAAMIELNDQEYCNVPNNDVETQKWAELLMKRGKGQGWFRRCIESGLLPEYYKRWPHHNALIPMELKPAKFPRKSVTTISGGAFEQNRRKH
jgi:hypothetical protein